MLKPVINLQADTTVSYLIDEAKGTWNENLVKECFNPSDAEKILQLPLLHNHCEDFPSWPYTKEGIYSVRSAHNLAKMEGFHKFLSVNGKGESSDMTKIKRVWKRLWMIKAPAKMKIILWRMAHDCLPTGMQLKHRHIPAPYACCFCGREETVEHALLMCQYASEVWRQVKKEYGIKRNLRSFNSIRQWFFEFLAEASDEVLRIFTITVWHIWEARNAVRNGESWVHPHCIVEKVEAFSYTCLNHLHLTGVNLIYP